MRQRCLRNKRLPIVPEAKIALRAQPKHQLIRDPRLRDLRLHTRRSRIGANPRRAAAALVRKHRAARLLRRVRMKTRRQLLIPPLIPRIVQRITQARAGQRRHRIRKLHRDLRARTQITRARQPGKLSVPRVRPVLRAHRSGKVLRLPARRIPHPYSIRPHLRDTKARRHNVRLRRRGMKHRRRGRALPSRNANLPAEVKATKSEFEGTRGCRRNFGWPAPCAFARGGCQRHPFYFGREGCPSNYSWSIITMTIMMMIMTTTTALYFSATTACLAFASSGRADPDPSHVFSSTA
jgi:hypothetical protein